MKDGDVVGTWVHAFEEDAPNARVFRRQPADLPRSRRPRAEYELKPDGSFVHLAPGPADKRDVVTGAWRIAGSDVELTYVDGRTERVTLPAGSSDRLLFKP
jgi:hypothetical protein